MAMVVFVVCVCFMSLCLFEYSTALLMYVLMRVVYTFLIITSCTLQCYESYYSMRIVLV